MEMRNVLLDNGEKVILVIGQQSIPASGFLFDFLLVKVSWPHSDELMT